MKKILAFIVILLLVGMVVIGVLGATGNLDNFKDGLEDLINRPSIENPDDESPDDETPDDETPDDEQPNDNGEITVSSYCGIFENDSGVSIVVTEDSIDASAVFGTGGSLTPCSITEDIFYPPAFIYEAQYIYNAHDFYVGEQKLATFFYYSKDDCWIYIGGQMPDIFVRV